MGGVLRASGLACVAGDPDGVMERKSVRFSRRFGWRPNNPVASGSKKLSGVVAALRKGEGRSDCFGTAAAGGYRRSDNQPALGVVPSRLGNVAVSDTTRTSLRTRFPCARASNIAGPRFLEADAVTDCGSRSPDFCWTSQWRYPFPVDSDACSSTAVLFASSPASPIEAAFPCDPALIVTTGRVLNWHLVDFFGSARVRFPSPLAALSR